MSHFCLYAILPEGTERDDVERVVGELMDPFSEERRVKPYKRKCGCVGWRALTDAQEQVNKEMGKFEDVRKKFNEENPENNDETQKKWENEVWGPRDKREKEIIAANPDKDKPDPKCMDCKGTGLEITTYNPDSKWDCWTLGGRWTGSLDGYDPSKDPKNIEVCNLCGGSGDRPEWVIYKKVKGKKVRTFKDDWAKECNGCNGCKGTGKSVKWPTQWKKHPGDTGLVKTIKEKDDPPFAVLTPEGEWYEKGEMGWFGISSNEKEISEWKKTVKELYEKYQECLVAVGDCHI